MTTSAQWKDFLQYTVEKKLKLQMSNLLVLGQNSGDNAITFIKSSAAFLMTLRK